MKRYILKAGYKSTQELEKAKNKLLNIGIKAKDIDYISNPKKKGKGLKFKKIDKGAILSLRFFSMGIAGGILLYFFSLFKTSELDFWGTLLSIKMSSMFLTTFTVAIFLLLIGYTIGKNYSLHTVEFSRNENTDKENILMSVNIDDDIIEKSYAELESTNSTSLELIDCKKEVELGLREQS